MITLMLFFFVIPTTTALLSFFTNNINRKIISSLEERIEIMQETIDTKDKHIKVLEGHLRK